ncbi:hypothetical protein [Hymenobacter rubripertinctus]|uniref:STAS/SEC14 domain-containing protein n=1 Tax=Hymenobacter rubripertinctus TaxID=2029981 RepID=A0A418R0U7_9BACT|nr:hypothetical protein [Hymenobacter rubripertinctus]RIY11052.1 hypothetical protein D0T11_08575 [Hymenobacter rubripertinctus]
MIERLLSNSRSPDYCRLRYEPQKQWLRVTWAGYVGSEYAREGALASLQMLRELPCPYLLNDNSQLEGPWFDSLFWLAQEWGPAAAAAGLQYVAHVVRVGTFANTFLLTPTHQLFNKFEIQIFDSAQEATEWLLSCQTAGPPE